MDLELYSNSVCLIPAVRSHLELIANCAQVGLIAAGRPRIETFKICIYPPAHKIIEPCSVLKDGIWSRRSLLSVTLL
jgi:hypothetical protein